MLRPFRPHVLIEPISISSSHLTFRQFEGNYEPLSNWMCPFVKKNKVQNIQIKKTKK